MSTKICTSIEQSKKLLSFGLDLNTADMFYPWHIEDEEDTFEDGYLLNTPVIGKYGGRGTIPCWSLTALLKLIPSINMIKGNSITINYGNHFSQDYNNPLDAAFEMVCWLIEQGHIK